jgi:hypothetical protein
MRYKMLLAMSAVFVPLVTFAQTATTTDTGYTVTYSPSTERVCPANSYLISTMCYCNNGYHVSGKTCAKDTAPAPTGSEIYEDIRMMVTLNDKMTCAQLGIALQPDLDMCTKFRAASDADKADWKSIQRPNVVNGPAIENPWAPAGAQVLSGAASTSQGIPANIPPPPAPKPAATTTPTSTKPTLPRPTETATEEVSPAAKALEKLKPTKFDENFEALKHDTELSPLKDSASVTAPAQPEVDPSPAPAPAANSEPAPQSFGQIAAAETSRTAVDMSQVIAGLSLIPATEPSPEPPHIPPESQPESHRSIFGKIVEWFFSIF